MRPAQFKSTVRHYLSNQNLRKDLIIHEKMCSSGWIRINDLPAHQIMQARRVSVHMLLKRRASVHSDQGTAEEPKTKAGQLGLQHGQEAAMEENIRRAAPAREESTAGRRASVHSDQGTAEPQQKESTRTRLRGPAPDLAGGRARALWTLYGPVFGFRLPTPLGGECRPCLCCPHYGEVGAGTKPTGRARVVTSTPGHAMCIVLPARWVMQGSLQKHWTLLKDGPWPLRMHQTFHTPRGAKVVLERKWNQRLTIAVTGNSKHKLPKKHHFHVSSESCRTVQNN